MLKGRGKVLISDISAAKSDAHILGSRDARGIKKVSLEGKYCFTTSIELSQQNIYLSNCYGHLSDER